MPLARGVDILEQMCAALARAHDLGVVHRDLKSDNILLTHARRPERLRQDPRLRPRAPRAWTRASPRRARSSGRPSTCRPSRRAAKRRRRRATSTRSACSSSRCSPGSSPSGANDRETLLEMQRTAAAAAPALDQAGRAARGRGHRRQAAREGPAQALPGRPPPPRGAEGAPAQPAQHAVGGRGAGDERRRRRRRRRRSRAGVIEWASRAALFSRMVVARLPDGQRAAGGAERARRRRGIWRRGRRGSRARSRATRASSRRSSGAGARSARRSGARSRSWRTRSRARCASCRPSRQEVARLREELTAGREARPPQARQPADAAAQPAAHAARRSSSGRARRRRSSRRSASSSASTRTEGGREGRAGARPAPADRGAPQPARPLRRGARGGPAQGREKVARAHARGARLREGVQRGVEPPARTTCAASPSAATS